MSVLFCTKRHTFYLKTWCSRMVGILIPYTLNTFVFPLSPLFRKCDSHWIWLAYHSDSDLNKWLYFVPLLLYVTCIYSDYIGKFIILYWPYFTYTYTLLRLQDILWHVSILPDTLNCRHVLYINIIYRKLCLINESLLVFLFWF